MWSTPRVVIPSPPRTRRNPRAPSVRNATWADQKECCAAQRGCGAEESGHTPWACIRFLRLFFCARWERPNIPHNYTRVKPHVSPCKPLCAIFLRKASVYPLSGVKANVGHLCEKLKNGMRSGLEQHCGGNFLAIFAGTVLDEKPNFTGRFFEWRRPFDFSTR